MALTSQDVLFWIDVLHEAVTGKPPPPPPGSVPDPVFGAAARNRDEEVA